MFAETESDTLYSIMPSLKSARGRGTGGSAISYLFGYSDKIHREIYRKKHSGYSDVEYFPDKLFVMA